MLLKTTINILLLILLLISAVNANNLRTQWEETTQLTVGDASNPGALIIGFVVGPILFFCSFALIWVNQKKAAIDQVRIKEALNKLQKMDKNQVVESLQNIIVYSSDRPLIVLEAQDNELGVKIEGALRIQRKVQVKEYRDINNQAQLIWMTDNQPEVLDKANPPSRWFLKQQTFNAKKVRMGSYFLNQQQLLNQPCNQHYQISENNIDNIVKLLHIPQNKLKLRQQYLYILSDGHEDTESHETIRIKYQYLKIPENYSVVAGLDQNNVLQPYQFGQADHDTFCCQSRAYCFLCTVISKCFKPISSLQIIKQGKYSSQQLIDQQMSMNGKIRLLFRLINFIIMTLGIYLLFLPMTDMLGYIPFFESYLSDIQGYIAIGSVLASVPLYVISLSIAWLVYSRVKGLILMGVAIAIIVILVVVGVVE